MKKTCIIFSIIILSMFLLTSSVFAQSIEYWPNGLIDIITLNEGTLEFYENGNVDILTTTLNGSDVTIEFYANNVIDIIETPSGTLDVEPNGLILYVPENVNQILKEAQAAAQNYYTAIENYFSKMNLDIDGVDSPTKDLEKLHDTLNNLITKYGTIDLNVETPNNSTPVDNSVNPNIMVPNNNAGNVNNPVTGNNVGNINTPVVDNNAGNINIPAVDNNTGNVNTPTVDNNTGINSTPNLNMGLSSGLMNNNGSIPTTGNNAAINGYGIELWPGTTNYKKLVLPEGIVTWHQTGHIESMTTSGLILYRHDDGYNKSIQTASGSIIYGEDGAVEKVNGEFATIMTEANNEYERMENAFNQFYEYGTITNSGNTSLSDNNNGGVNFLADANKDANSGNNIVKYILIGLAFFVAFVILIFGIIAIKKKNNQIVVK